MVPGGAREEGDLADALGWAGATLESCLEARQRWGRDWIPSGTCYLRVTPKCGGQCFLSLARQGWGLAREGRWRWPGRRNSFHFPAGCRERVPGARELGCQYAKPGGIRIARCNAFVGLSRETEAGEGLMESEADLGSEMLQR